jgi:hypothetical protein
MSRGLLTETAAFLEEWLPGGWHVDVWDKGGAEAVSMTCSISAQQIEAARYNPGRFLQELAPDPKRVQQALENRRGVRFVGPYASRACMRRLSGL